MRDVALALGSNLGDSLTILQGAVDDLARVPGLELVAVSEVFETDPVGGPEQPVYLNAVVVGRTSLSGGELLTITQAIEHEWHRTRDVRWGPRTLDIDILALGDERVESDVLTLPHPRAHERAFVLVPWVQVQPLAMIPGHGTVSELLARVPDRGVRPRGSLLTLPRPDRSAMTKAGR